MTTEQKIAQFPLDADPREVFMYMGKITEPSEDYHPRALFRKLKFDLRAWKKTRTEPHGVHCILVELLIPAGATIFMQGDMNKFSSALDTSDRKMRAEKALVVAQHTIEDPWQKGGREVNTSVSDWNSYFPYCTGKIVRPTTKFSRDADQCEAGIHFFLHRQDAIDYAM